jgi:NAD dependent epimerase/dehydratase
MNSMSGARALVTGADGFIGSHLVERLLDEGAEVRAFCFYNSNATLGWLEELDSNRRDALDVRLGDIRDAGFVRDAVDGVDLVFHLAALIAIPYSYRAPASFVETNVQGTLNVLEAARKSGVNVINTSTSEVYGTPEAVPITENHPLRAQSPYSATKIAADKLAEAYALSFEVPVITLRPFNTFGPRQSARAVVPTIIGQLLAGAEKVRLGSLTPKRDFTYVSDTVDGFIKTASADVAPGATIQLGTGNTISIGDLFTLCCEITGSLAEVVVEEERIRPAGSEVQILQSDPSQAKALLGWVPQVSLREGLERTAAWLAGRASSRQVDNYQV